MHWCICMTKMYVCEKLSMRGGGGGRKVFTLGQGGGGHKCVTHIFLGGTYINNEHSIS